LDQPRGFRAAIERRTFFDPCPKQPSPPENLSFERFEVGVRREEPEAAGAANGDPDDAPVGLDDETI
jgi:hypothetical protein